MNYLPDVNVWIALGAERHAHHRTARKWYHEVRSGPGDSRLMFCRVTQLGFLRLLTNRHVMQEEVLRPEEAWQAYVALRRDRRVGFVAEPLDVPEIWSAFTEGRGTSPNLWTDAYLCALASAARFPLVTFDSRLARADGLNCVLLTDGE